MSRQHARITVVGDQVLFEDLGSRNGSKVNSAPARGKMRLEDGDRLRIGTVEMVVCRIANDGSGPSPRKTGYLLYCAGCRLPYADEAVSCPHCGSQEKVDDETTLTGKPAEEPTDWGIQLAVEVIERALSTERYDDAERMMRRAADEVDAALAGGRMPDPDHFRKLAEVGSRFASVRANSDWATWFLSAFAKQNLVPDPEVVLALKNLRLDSSGVQAINQILQSAKATKGTLRDAELEALTILSVWGRCLKNGAGA